MGRPVLVAVMAGCAVLLAACAATEESPRSAEGAAAGTAAETAPREALSYEARIVGVADSSLRDLLQRTSRLMALSGDPPLSRVQLDGRISEDLERFRTVLRSEGYYASEISSQVSDGEPPLSIEITVSPGPLYRLEEYEIVYRPALAPDLPAPRTMEDVGLRKGEPARAAAIVEAGRRLVRRLQSLGRPFAAEADRRAVVDHATRTMAVTLTVDPGPEATFGPTAFEGLETVDEAYLRRFIRWEEGGRFDQDKVDALAERLRDTNLFGSVVVQHAERTGPGGRLPMTVHVTEREHRTISVGASYSSSEGAGADAYWEHRNLFGQQERLRISAVAAAIRQSLTFDFRKPNYKRLDQALLATTEGIRQQTDAFDEVGGSQFVGLERRLNQYWRVSAGGSLEYTQITDNQGTRDFLLVGVPGWAMRDDTDDILDPTRGTRLRLDLTPYYTFVDESFPFVRALVSGSVYKAVLGERRVVVAGRAKLGSIAGGQTDDIPANKRFYAGGGGSIRGYEFQKVGPLDANEDPIGGRSLLEVGAELRIRATETIGVVPFVEAGNVFDSSVPDFSDDLLIGAGLGLRYFTAIGPLRLDVAFPVNRREGIDDVFQFYISLGQAF